MSFIADPFALNPEPSNIVPFRRFANKETPEVASREVSLPQTENP
jgi:hypothetical protein